MSEDYSIILNPFGARLRKLRKGKKLTLIQVSALSGVDMGDISRIEKGDINFQYSTLCRLAVGLEMEPRQLFESLAWDPNWKDKYDKNKLLKK